ncbi:hypothetical protein V1478_008717 [Vespula squamosa]|uniref:Ribosomal protein L32 n=1 Tax=Vespula squamosa TaxID=30214 RepID=A0ABD2AUA3_VESSQ
MRYRKKCISKSSNLQRYYTRNPLITVAYSNEDDATYKRRKKKFVCASKVPPKWRKNSHGNVTPISRINDFKS